MSNIQLNQLYLAGSDLIIAAVDLKPELREALRDCGTPGQDATEAVDYVMDTFEIRGNDKDCRAYLSTTGGWQADELQDHNENLRRCVWLIGCDLNEGEEAHLSTY